jgi:endoglucanase
MIKVNHVGYLPRIPKVALVTAANPATEFTLRRVDGTVAFSGKLAAAVDDPQSGDKVQAADFSACQTSGKYYIDVPGIGRSWEFSIAANVYARVFYLAMRSYYSQRCGIAVDLGSEAPGYKHGACHLKGAWHGSSGKAGPRVSAKGWHDAGDYGRYVVNSGITTGTLLWTYEMFPDYVKNVSLNIPESGNAMPDILNEIKWNLDWMLSMQDDDGGVWHKQTSEKFSGFIMPERDDLISFVIGTGREPYKSSCATGDFAAVLAIAARIYKPFQPQYANQCLCAAMRAYSWLEKNPAVQFNNPPGVLTGLYDDINCVDERLWAAAELTRTTGQEIYAKSFKEHYVDFKNSIRAAGPWYRRNVAKLWSALLGERRNTETAGIIRAIYPQNWRNVANLGLWSYVLGGGRDTQTAAAIREATLIAADEIVIRTTTAGYRNSMTAGDYIWGSNGVAANYGMQLLIANALRNDRRYVQTALDNLHYLLGRNPFSMSYITGVGLNSPRHPHHRPSIADGIDQPWPGLLVLGPNIHREDPITRAKVPAGVPPARAYIDHQGAYSVNEVAINCNAPLVFLLAGVANGD